jgi:hypothetical protein
VERADFSIMAGEVVSMRSWLKRLMEFPRLIIWLGMFVFIYAWLAGLLLQLWVIPTLFTQPGAAEGLVVLDSIGFDRIAKKKAAEITSLGWSAWELKPQSQSPAGIASVFYALFGPTPASLLPFNAAIHALNASVVMLILRNFFSVVPALIGALVFALNPASFEWVAQIHRDGMFILGNLLLIFGILRFIRGAEQTNRREAWYWLVWLLIPIMGTLLIWVARPYWIQVALVTLILTAVIVMLATLLQGKIAGRKVVLFVVMVLLLGTFQLWLIRFHTPYEPIDIPAIQTDSQAGSRTDRSAPFVWQRSNWLPEAIEGRFYRIRIARQGAISQGGNSLVDAEWRLNSVGAIVGYTPRALQLGLFSPFPKLWGGEGSTPAMTMARKVVGGVTLFFYLCLIGLAIGLWRMRWNLLLWVMVGACLTGILVYAVTYPNIGTLIRYRYGFYMLLIGFGAAWWCEQWIKRTDRSSKE